MNIEHPPAIAIGACGIKQRTNDAIAYVITDAHWHWRAGRTSNFE
jgi:hypothetical protein